MTNNPKPLYGARLNITYKNGGTQLIYFATIDEARAQKRRLENAALGTVPTYEFETDLGLEASILDVQGIACLLVVDQEKENNLLLGNIYYQKWLEFRQKQMSDKFDDDFDDKQFGVR